MGTNSYNGHINIDASLDSSNLIRELQKVQSLIDEINKDTAKTQSQTTKGDYREFTQAMSQLFDKRSQLQQFQKQTISSEQDVQNFAALNKEVAKLITTAGKAGKSFLSGVDLTADSERIKTALTKAIDDGLKVVQSKIGQSELGVKIADQIRQGLQSGNLDLDNIRGKLTDIVTKKQKQYDEFQRAVEERQTLEGRKADLTTQLEAIQEQRAAAQRAHEAAEQSYQNAIAEKRALEQRMKEDPKVVAAQERLAQLTLHSGGSRTIGKLNAGFTLPQEIITRIQGLTSAAQDGSRAAETLAQKIRAAVSGSKTLEQARAALETKNVGRGASQRPLSEYIREQGISQRGVDNVLQAAFRSTPFAQAEAAAAQLAQAQAGYKRSIEKAEQSIQQEHATREEAKKAAQNLVEQENNLTKAVQGTETAIQRQASNAEAAKPGATEYKQASLMLENLKDPEVIQALTATQSKVEEIKSSTGQTGQKVEEAKASLTGVDQRLKVLTTEQKKFEQEAAKTAKTFSSINKTFDRLMYTFERMFSIFTIYTKLSQVIKKTFQDVQAIDKAYGSIAMVTSKTVGEMWTTYSQYADIANRLGQTTESAIKTSALFYQQGLKEVEVLSLTESTMKLATLAGQDFETSTKQLTAALRAFHMEMDQGEHITDVYSELAAHAAADVKGIAYAMSKTASIAASAGASFENTAAFITQMIN